MRIDWKAIVAAHIDWAGTPPPVVQAGIDWLARHDRAGR